MLIAAAARLEEPDILILDEPTNHLDLANINTLERWLTVEFNVPMLIVSHDREFLDRVTERTLFLRSRRRACLQDALLGGARGAAAPRRHGGGAGAAGGQGDQAAGAGGGALQGVGGQEPRSQQAQERRREPHRAHREASARRPMSRANAGSSWPTATSTPRWRCASPNLDVKVPGGGRKLIGIDRLDHRRRRARGAAGRQRRRQVDAALGAGRRLRSGARALRRPGRRALQSVLPPGLFRPDACATCRSTTTILDYVVEAEGVTEKDAIRHARPAPASPSCASRSRSAC